MSDLAKADWSDTERVKSIAESYHQRYGDTFWKQMVKLVGDVKIDTIGDFGCGPGLFLRDAVKTFEADDVVGLDASAEMLAYAKQIALSDIPKKNVNLVQIDFDVTRIELPPRSIHLGFSGYMLHEVADPLDFASQVYGTISQEGRYAVFDFVSGNRDEFIRIMSEGHMTQEKARTRYPHMCKHSITDIEDIIAKAGFSSIASVQLDPIRAIVLGIKGTTTKGG